MIAILVNLKPRSDVVQAFEDSLGKLLELVRQEPGNCGIYWGKTIDEDTYSIVERYADQDALSAHQQSSHMAELGPQVAGLCDGAPVATMFVEM